MREKDSEQIKKRLAHLVQQDELPPGVVLIVTTAQSPLAHATSADLGFSERETEVLISAPDIVSVFSLLAERLFSWKGGGVGCVVLSQEVYHVACRWRDPETFRKKIHRPVHNPVARDATIQFFVWRDNVLTRLKRASVAPEASASCVLETSNVVKLQKTGG